MGLETEKADTRIFMDDDNFPGSGGPALSEGEKGAEDELDRDPRGLNAHLQVRGGPRPRGDSTAEPRRAAEGGEGGGGRGAVLGSVAGPGPAEERRDAGGVGVPGGGGGYPSVSPRPRSP